MVQATRTPCIYAYEPRSFTAEPTDSHTQIQPGSAVAHAAVRKLCLDLQQRVTGESSRLGLAPTAISNGVHGGRF